MEDFQQWLRLQITPGVGAQTAAGLLRRYGSPAEIFRQPESALRRNLRPELAAALRRVPAGDRKSTRLNSSHYQPSRMPSSA